MLGIGGRMTLLKSLQIPFLFLSLASLLAYALYQQAFQAGFLYDDALTFAGLKEVFDTESALLFVMSGDAGPLGRPLSLASFLLNASSWPSSPGDFHYINTLLHLVNGFLVAWLAFLVACSMPDRLKNPQWFAVLVASVWLLHPAWTFLVLHAVQRMAILSATFALLGLIAYLKARGLMETRPRLSMVLMAASLGLGTLLAMLAKENGVLLPLFAATLEWLLRRTGPALPTAVMGPNPGLALAWKFWGKVLFWLPVIALAYFLWPHWPGFNSAAGIREFTGGQRLLTEANVLWQYLLNQLLPRPLNFTPFYDDYEVSKGLFEPVSTLYAVLGWVLVGGAAWHWRRYYPLLLFASAWFFVGHSIESTIVQLEIYFEHRNYLPSVGPIFLAVYGLWQLPEKLKRLAWIVAGAYLLLLSLVLGQVTSLWSNQTLAAEVWVERHPYSMRTVQLYADRLAQNGQVAQAAEVIWQAHVRMPEDTGLAVQGVELMCWVSSPEAYELLVNEMLPQLRVGRFSNQLSTSLPAMFNQLASGSCPAQRAQHLHNIIDALMQNPGFRASPRTMATLHYLKGRLFMREGDFNSTLTHLLAASRREASLDLSLEIAAVFASGGLYDEAFKTLDVAMKRAPRNPVLRRSWEKRLEEGRSQLLAAKPSSASKERISR
jgi:protein O-mannosyl-transferase